MIEFQLQVDSRITRAVTTFNYQMFFRLWESLSPSFPYLNEDDTDLLEAWKSSLREDMSRSSIPCPVIN